MHLFSTPWKHQKTVKVFWCFQGVEKGYIENKWVKEKIIQEELSFWYVASYDYKCKYSSKKIIWHVTILLP